MTKAAAGADARSAPPNTVEKPVVLACILTARAIVPTRVAEPAIATPTVSRKLLRACRRTDADTSSACSPQAHCANCCVTERRMVFIRFFSRLRRGRGGVLHRRAFLAWSPGRMITACANRRYGATPTNARRSFTQEACPLEHRASVARSHQARRTSWPQE
jgi:hypothetical protein